MDSTRPGLDFTDANTINRNLERIQARKREEAARKEEAEEIDDGTGWIGGADEQAFPFEATI